MATIFEVVMNSDAWFLAAIATTRMKPTRQNKLGIATPVRR